MGHKFDSKNKHKLDNPKRRILLPPEKILMQAGLKKDMVMADVGCGIGYFTIPAASLVGENGQILALDLSRDMLDTLQEKITEQGIDNVVIIKNDENKLPIDNNKVDMAFLCHVVHEVEDKGVFIDEVKRVVKPGGFISIIEWEKKPTDSGPPLDERISRNEIRKVLENAGFMDITIKEIGEYFYLAKGKK
ncbi:class I SAM-dependent methyltransferase [Thermosyntropha sp.]|uniref:class I SAM-dependent methyltransferase n=1 Tax=Thermosyntropha sp. TaxID=2740820 RepID=UPI0025F1C4E5|nr:class I SAM-dependent methyltransferase [Thermosyntropha sp.]MBO8159585.1 class I SAM-dependent methyltransferase [Thermosyntropha sp.]